MSIEQSSRIIAEANAALALIYAEQDDTAHQLALNPDPDLNRGLHDREIVLAAQSQKVGDDALDAARARWVNWCSPMSDGHPPSQPPMVADRSEITKLGLDFGEAHVRAEAVREDGTFVWSKLSAFGQKLADRSARRGRAWKHDAGFNPWADAPRRKSDRPAQISAYDEAMEKMFAPILLDFRE